MRLSEAIRLGSTLGPQLRDGFLVGPGNASCALGAALLALGADCEEAMAYDPLNCPSDGSNLHKVMQKHRPLHKLLLQYFPALNSKPDRLYFPASTGVVNNSLHTQIWRLNDRTTMTREEIADWIVANGYDCESVDLPVYINTEQPEEEAVCV